jgi:hypothetical protein
MIAIWILVLFYQEEHDAAFCVKRVTDVLGTQERWNAVRYICFDFAVERGGVEVSRHRHLWDKWTGRYRVEGKNRQGQKYQMAFDNVNRKKGRVRIEGREITSDSLSKFLDYGYARFINDTYWLAMPWKLNDPGVRLDHSTKSGRCIIKMTFDRVGLTPGDTYWVVADSAGGQLFGWKFKLEDGEEGDFDWTGWKSVGGLRLSEVKTSRDRQTVIRTEHIQIFDSLSDELFLSFDTPLPQ